MKKSAVWVVTKFCLISLVIYISLSAPWPAIRPAYRSMLIAGANALYHNFGEYGDVRFEVKEGTDEGIEVTVQNKQNFTAGGANIHSGRVGFTTTALTFALIAATPISWRRRMWCVVAGFVATQLFVMGRIGLYLTFVYSQDLPFRLFTPGRISEGILKMTYEFLFNAPGGTVIAAVVIWLSIAIRASDMSDILGLSDANDRSKP